MNINHKYGTLDTLRWLAAFAVGMGHSFLCFNINGKLPHEEHYYWTMIFNGSYAVDLFFVLSGFVLINATSSLTYRSYVGFVARRALRIYPASWLSLAMALFAIVLVHLIPRYGSPWVSSWAVWLLEVPVINVNNVLQSLALTNTELNPILWTIVIELVASALYPLFAILIRRHKKLTVAFSILFLVVLSWFISGNKGVINATHYLYMFAVGASINLLRPCSKKIFGTYALLLALVLMLLSRVYGQTHTFSEDLLSTISAALLVGSIAFSCPKIIERFLSNNRMIMLGRASYSYYLINSAVLFVLVNYYPIFGISFPNNNADYVLYSLTLGFCAACITIPASLLSAKTVEKVSIGFGRRVEKRILSKNSSSYGLGIFLATPILSDHITVNN